jgi:hypothetical protein
VPLSEINVPALIDDDIIRYSLLCLQSNPYNYADNAQQLINSGSLEVILKDKNGNILKYGDIMD